MVVLREKPTEKTPKETVAEGPYHSDKPWRPGDRRLRLSDSMASPSEITTSSSEALGVPADEARKSGGKE